MGSSTQEKSYDPLNRAASLMEEFKNFAFQGNVVDLAVGVIIGTAFGKRARTDSGPGAFLFHHSPLGLDSEERILVAGSAPRAVVLVSERDLILLHFLDCPVHRGNHKGFSPFHQGIILFLNLHRLSVQNRCLGILSCPGGRMCGSKDFEHVP